MNNAQKTPILESLSRIANDRARKAISLTGRALPASVTAVSAKGNSVTVKFELTNIPWTIPQIECPLGSSEFVRLPIGVGCQGVVFPADYGIGNMSGLGASTSDLTPQGNLSALTFFPIGNIGWSDRESATKTIIYGPDGSILRSLNKNYSVEVNQTEVIIQKSDGTLSFTIDSSGSMKFHGNAIFDGQVTVLGNIALQGTLLSETGGLFAGNIHTSGNIISGIGGSDQVGLSTHVHTANNTPPTPGS